MMGRIKLIYVVAGFALILLGYTFVFQGTTLLIWNKTTSAPKGMYLWKASNVENGDWAILKGTSASARWIADHDYIGLGWPIIKRVVASEGDEICRENLVISVNDTPIAEALETDFYGEKLPSWSGCRRLKANQYFLINNHPHSLDGRYFGPEEASDLSGSARLIWTES